MIASQMYNIEVPTDETFLSSSKNIMIVATIFQQAIFKHQSIYKRRKKEVPLSFVEFYFTEIKNYSYMFRKQTKEFFETFDRILPNFYIIAEVYVKSFFSQASALKTRKGERFLILNEDKLNDYTTDMIDTSSKDVVSAITNIKKITEHINHADEIIPFYKSYENYMIAQIIKKKEFATKYAGKSKVIVNVYNNEMRQHVVAATKHAERLTSERINIASQKGKITKIVIPKLKLPTAYPKTVTFNRYNSKFRARNFVSASRQILILNDMKINGVAYSTNFVEKRKAINESQ